MKKTTRIVLAVVIAATLLGGYLIVTRNGPQPGSLGDTPSGFLH
jgi:hypothetical protein